MLTKLLALAAISLGAAAPARRVLNEASTSCPPAGFDSARNFSLERYTSAPWYSIEQLPVWYMPPSQLFCARETDVLKDDKTATVYWESRKGGSKGQKANPPEMVMHQDDLAEATANKETAASKLRVGLQLFDFIYSAGPSSSSEQHIARMLPTGSADDSLDASKMIRVLKKILFKPYWVVYVDEDYQWAITTAGPPEVPSHGLCTTSDTLGIQGAGVYLVHRDPFPSPEVVQQMRDKAEELGLDVSVLQKVTHTGCDYSHSATGNE